MNAEPREPSDPGLLPDADAESLIGPYLDGELPPGEARRIEALLEESSTYRDLANHYRKLDDLARETLHEVPRVSAARWGEMWETIQREGAVRPAGSRRFNDWIVPLISLAALLLLGLYLGSLFLGDPEGATPEGPPVSQPDIEEVPSLEGEEFDSVDFSG